MGSYPVKTKGDFQFLVWSSLLYSCINVQKYEHTNQESLCILYETGAKLFLGVLMSKFIVIKVAVSWQEACYLEGP